MTILFAGGEMCALDPSGGSVSETTGGTRYDSGLARCSIVADGGILDPGGFWASTEAWTEATGDFYLHFEAETGIVGVVAHTMLELLDGAGAAKFRVRQTNVASNVGALQMQYWNGSAWVSAGSTVAVISGARSNYDIYVNRATGVMEFFVAGTSQVSVTGLSLSHISGVASANLHSDGTGRYWSQIIAADVPTIGWKLATYYPSGNGTNTAWTNGYTEVDEIAFNDGDVIYSASAGDVETFTATGPSLTGYTVLAVGVYARARRGASGPQNLQLALMASGTNYFSGTKALGTGFAATGAIWETNPNTSGAWATTDIAALEHGVKAIA